MTSLMKQVTCSLCNTKIDEVEWPYHIVSTNPLQFCEIVKNEIAINFFEMIFYTFSKKNELYILKNYY